MSTPHPQRDTASAASSGTTPLSLLPPAIVSDSRLPDKQEFDTPAWQPIPGCALLQTRIPIASPQDRSRPRVLAATNLPSATSFTPPTHAQDGSASRLHLVSAKDEATAPQGSPLNTDDVLTAAEYRQLAAQLIIACEAAAGLRTPAQLRGTLIAPTVRSHIARRHQQHQYLSGPIRLRSVHIEQQQQQHHIELVQIVGSLSAGNWCGGYTATAIYCPPNNPDTFPAQHNETGANRHKSPRRRIKSDDQPMRPYSHAGVEFTPDMIQAHRLGTHWMITNLQLIFAASAYASTAQPATFTADTMPQAKASTPGLRLVA
ncbi:hypothetical protein ACFPVT_02375 [Corynebacterium choanae]|uniref:Uncharacterized protein n=1 Tax=Corynebacterium choanae TaxID=1862358 RepID=A0A3G6J4P7_9CORY|nr:hypothetical protein [Corynebacterium choanae]AZA12919.1 hypothetical protein CCHOA_02510 [Corynebacterium choanae]